MAADPNWIDTLRQRGFGRRISASAMEVDSQSAGITFTTSGVRLACAVKNIGKAQTLPALVAIKDAAKTGLLERDLPALKKAYEARQQYLRAIPTTQTNPDQE